MEPSYCEKYCVRRVSCFPQLFFLTRSWLLNSLIDLVFKLRRSTFWCNIKYYLIMSAITYCIFCHEDTFFSCWTPVEDPNAIDYPTYLQTTAHLALCLQSPATNDTLLALHMCWEMEWKQGTFRWRQSQHLAGGVTPDTMFITYSIQVKSHANITTSTIILHLKKIKIK